MRRLAWAWQTWWVWEGDWWAVAKHYWEYQDTDRARDEQVKARASQDLPPVASHEQPQGDQAQDEPGHAEEQVTRGKAQEQRGEKDRRVQAEQQSVEGIFRVRHHTGDEA